MESGRRFSGSLNSKVTLVTAALLLVCPSILMGQSAPAAESYVQNNTGYTLYVRPVSGSEYRQVPPGGLLPTSTDEDLEGFLYNRTSFQMPTVRISAAMLASGEFLEITSADLSEVQTMSPSDVAETLSAPRLDNRYLDWLSVSPLFARARGRQPLGSFRDQGSGRVEIVTGESLLWERAGTDLEWMKTSRQGDDLYIAASTYSLFTRTSSVNLYIYGTGNLPVASIDINASGESGYVFMWMPQAPEPVVVGNSVASDFFVEAQIWLDVVATVLSGDSEVGEVLAGTLLARDSLTGRSSARGDAADGVSVEISTATSAAGTWEEFVLARVSLSSLLAP